MISRDNKKLMESCRWIFGENDLHLGPKSGDESRERWVLIRKQPPRVQDLQMRSLSLIEKISSTVHKVR